MNNNFDRSKHIYHNEAFVELVKDAIRFFMVRLFIHFLHPNSSKVQGFMRFTISVTILCTNNMRTGTDYPTMRQFMLASSPQRLAASKKF